MSIVFDRAVEYYDQTRAMPPERHRAMIDALVRETGLNENSRVLEVGIGTGRIGMSVAEHLRRLFGIDLSLEMMGVLRRKLAETNLNIRIAQADAGKLPFAAETFDVVYAVHVYHLVAGWQNAMRDARRIIQRGGYFVISFHKRADDSPNARLRDQLHVLVNARGIQTKRPGATSEDEILDEIQAWGDESRIVVCSAWAEDEVPEKILEELDRQIFSETWVIPRAVMDEVMPQLREWAEKTFGDLSKPIAAASETRWLVTKKL
ncbi:MAG: SAM-dependent methyltransferase [Chloroflexota bacterium]|nr:MAG: SAM-dependent methyltransferase [Chloroflexota bacterium]